MNKYIVTYRIYSKNGKSVKENKTVTNFPSEYMDAIKRNLAYNQSLGVYTIKKLDHLTVVK
jgi:hypothetical protein